MALASPAPRSTLFAGAASLVILVLGTFVYVYLWGSTAASGDANEYLLALGLGLMPFGAWGTWATYTVLRLEERALRSGRRPSLRHRASTARYLLAVLPILFWAQNAWDAAFSGALCGLNNPGACFPWGALFFLTGVALVILATLLFGVRPRRQRVIPAAS